MVVCRIKIESIGTVKVSESLQRSYSNTLMISVKSNIMVEIDGFTSIWVVFKQKTAYEICRRDWSSDVCSSDLALVLDHQSVTRQSTKIADHNLALHLHRIDDAGGICIRVTAIAFHLNR